MGDDVSAVLERLRPGLAEDGADLQLVDVASGTAVIRLVLSDDACAECIVSRAAFEAMLRSQLVGKVPDVTAVRVIDPREDA